MNPETKDIEFLELGDEHTELRLAPSGEFAVYLRTDADHSRKLQVLKCSTGEPTGTIDDLPEVVHFVEWYPEVLAYGGYRDDRTRIVLPPSMKVVRYANSPSGSATAFAVAEDGARFAIGTGDGHVGLYDLSSGEMLASFSGLLTAVSKVAFTTSTVACGSARDGRVILWNPADDTRALVADGEWSIDALAVFTPARLLAAGDHYKTVSLFSTEAPFKRVASFDIGQARQLHFTAKGLIIATWEHGIYLCHGSNFACRKLPVPSDWQLRDVAATADGQWLYAFGKNRERRGLVRVRLE